MGFLDHLDELRKRIIRSCVALGAGMMIAFVFVDRIADFVLGPTLRILPAGTDLYFQMWIEDSAAVHGLSASNGVWAETM